MTNNTYVLRHRHKYGESEYFFTCNQNVATDITEDQERHLIKVLDIDFEPELGEEIEITPMTDLIHIDFEGSDVAVEKDYPTVALFLQGGLIQWAGSDRPMNVIIIDDDVNEEDGECVEWTDKFGEKGFSRVYEQDTFIDDLFITNILDTVDNQQGNE